MSELSEEWCSIEQKLFVDEIKNLGWEAKKMGSSVQVSVSYPTAQDLHRMLDYLIQYTDHETAISVFEKIEKSQKKQIDAKWTDLIIIFDFSE